MKVLVIGGYGNFGAIIAATLAGRLVVSGASSVPGLSSAVVERLAAPFASMETIDIGTSASQKTPGLATVGSVLSYCGKPFSRWRDAEWCVVHGVATHARPLSARSGLPAKL